MRRALPSLLPVLLLVACGGAPPAPVQVSEDRSDQGELRARPSPGAALAEGGGDTPPEAHEDARDTGARERPPLIGRDPARTAQGDAQDTAAREGAPEVAAHAPSASSAALSPAPIVAASGGARPPPPPAVMVAIQQAEDDLLALQALRALLARIRAQVELRPGAEPPAACMSPLRTEVTSLVRQGAAVSASHARVFRDLLDDLCRRYEQWNEPGTGQRTRMRRYVSRLDRIDQWMRDIRRCISPGPYDRRCENAYGAASPGDAAQAREAMRVVDEVRRELLGVPDSRRFPCRSPLWERISAHRWTMSVARAQLPQLATEARSICESLGVEAGELAELVRRIRERVERSTASAFQLATSRRATLMQMRAAWGLPSPPP